MNDVGSFVESVLPKVIAGLHHAPYRGKDAPPQPWRFDGHLVATTAGLLLAVRAHDEGDDRMPQNEKLAKLLASARDAVGAAVNEPPLVPEVPKVACYSCRGFGVINDCESCEGSGSCTCPECDYEHECRTCRGSGNGKPKPGTTTQTCEECKGEKTLYESPHMGVELAGGARLDHRYLRFMVENLPGLRFAATDPASVVMFRFDFGYGVVMPLGD